jgi:hypothetical protein
MTRIGTLIILVFALVGVCDVTASAQTCNINTIAVVDVNNNGHCYQSVPACYSPPNGYAMCETGFGCWDPVYKAACMGPPQQVWMTMGWECYVGQAFGVVSTDAKVGSPFGMGDATIWFNLGGPQMAIGYNTVNCQGVISGQQYLFPLDC